MMRLFEFWTFYYSFLFLMDFFLKEAVHQRAFCSYIVFFTEENTVQPYFFFPSQNNNWRNGAYTRLVRSLTSSVELRRWRSVCRLLRSYIASTGRLGQIYNLVLQWEGLAVNFPWFYCKSRISVSYHSPSFFPFLHQFPFFKLFNQRSKIKNQSLNKSQNKFFLSH